MKVIFIITNDKIPYRDITYEADLPIVPRKGEYVDVDCILTEDELDRIYKTASCWSGSEGEVMEVSLLKDNAGWYYKLWISCEDV